MRLGRHQRITHAIHASSFRESRFRLCRGWSYARGFRWFDSCRLCAPGVAACAGRLNVRLLAKEVHMKWVLRIAGGFAALLLIAVTVLFALGHRANAGRVRVSAELNASPEQIWPWLNTSDKLKQWITWLVEIRQDQPGTRVGTKQVWVMRDSNNGGHLGEREGALTRWPPPARESVHIT